MAALTASGALAVRHEGVEVNVASFIDFTTQALLQERAPVHTDIIGKLGDIAAGHREREVAFQAACALRTIANSRKTGDHEKQAVIVALTHALQNPSISDTVRGALVRIARTDSDVWGNKGGLATHFAEAAKRYKLPSPLVQDVQNRIGDIPAADSAAGRQNARTVPAPALIYG